MPAPAHKSTGTSNPNANSLRLEPMRPSYFFTPELELEINKLDGVTAARVVSTGTEIDEIHVLGHADRSPKKIVRDIESLLLVQYGIRIDHRCIGIVQTTQHHPPKENALRPQIHQISHDEEHIRVTVHVGGTEIIGVAARNDRHSDQESTALALIHAIEQMLNISGVLTLEAVQTWEAQNQKIAAVLVRWAFGNEQELFVGASLIQADPLQAVARATLDALNRRLVRFQRAALQHT